MDEVKDIVFFKEGDIDSEEDQPEYYADGDTARCRDDSPAVERVETDEDEAMKGHG